MPQAPTSLSTAQAAALLSLTPRRVRQLASDGVLRREGRDAWPFPAIVRDYISHLERGDPEPSRTAKVTDARTREIELKIAKAEADLMPLSEAQEGMEIATRLFLDSLDGLPAKIGTTRRERSRIAEIVAPMRERLVERFAGIGRSLRTGEPVNPD